MTKYITFFQFVFYLAILVEVSSEGCFDPPVRKRTQDASLQTQKRKRRGLG